MNKISYVVISAVIAGLFCVQALPSYAVLEEIGSGLDKLAGNIMQELNSQQEVGSDIVIKGDHNEVNVDQKAKQEPDYNLETTQVPLFDQASHVGSGDLTVKVKVNGNCDSARVGVVETGETEVVACGETATLKHQDILVGEEFTVCGDSEDGSDCVTGVNHEKKAPEHVTLNL